MTVTVELVEAKNGQVSDLIKLCTVSGKIPVYADKGRPASFNASQVAGCTMKWKGQTLDVSVVGAMAVAPGRSTFVTAGVSVVLPGSKPACHLCGPQPLADSRGEIRVSGTPKSLKFSLSPNPTSVLNARPTVWFNVDVAVVD